MSSLDASTTAISLRYMVYWREQHNDPNTTVGLLSSFLCFIDFALKGVRLSDILLASTRLAETVATMGWPNKVFRAG